MQHKNASYSLEAFRQLPDEDLASIVYDPVVKKSLPENTRKQELGLKAPFFLNELKRTGVTRLLLWEQYRKESVTLFGYTQFVRKAVIAVLTQRIGCSTHFVIFYPS